MSTTIRVDEETHAELAALSKEAGTSLMDTVRDAAEALRRVRFGQRVAAELAELRRDPEAWEDYLREAGSTATVDGLR